ncbi:restriction endonuclease subunit S [Ralstonia pseudosolanacearum]|uniref:restriction endonuclease subunit S n=1 Tax=Ralstonia pseudosolanacearum TaxID=1310165 RepID=UPI0019F57238|nr:restriction endonuclease subunit S [Ralstonia pseudosolanacearum]NJZ83617.1 restriction endonuclease subunit S [Ralstonia solanacearum]UYR06878.1 restriction endonuclease subunit S [Ralstonia pseudosolanacearum]
MMEAANAYPGYRTARMRWLPPVPEHWNEQRAKTFFREVDERSKTGQEELLSVSHLTGVTPRSQKNVTMFKAASYVGSKLCRPGDIVINTLWAWMAALGASKHVGIVSPAYGVYRPHRADSFNPAYLDYLLRTQAYVAEYIGRSTGIRSSRLRLYPNQFLDIALLQPPRPEQDQIVAYLRAQDAHIVRFIKAKRDLIGLLNEQKLRIIDHAVTRGLDASVALKPSGIEWLGDVPEHWSIKPLKRWVRLNASTLGEKTNPEFEFRYVDIGSVKTGRLAKELERLRFENAPSRARRVLRRGDTIISTVRTYLKAIWYVNEEADDLIASTGFAVLTPGREVEPEYLGYVIQSTGFVNRVTANSIGIAYPAIAETVLGRFPVVMPATLEEQQTILAHIKAESAPLDQAIEQALTEIKLIREYRDRQITDVVTGQVDVRGWVPGPDDVVVEEDMAALGGDEEIDTDGEEDDGDD